jgi:hypothetical protein
MASTPWRVAPTRIGAVIRLVGDHLLKGSLGALHVSGAQVHGADLGADARTDRGILARGQRSPEQPRGLAGLVEREAERHEAAPHVVVRGIGRADRAEQLKGTRWISEHVLLDESEPPLRLQAPRSSHELDLHAEHLGGALEPAEFS